MQGPALLCILIVENSSKHDILTKISCSKCYVLYIGAFLFLPVVNTVYCENFSEKRYTQQLSVSLKLSLLETLQCLCGTHGFFFCGLFNYSHRHQIWSGWFFWFDMMVPEVLMLKAHHPSLLLCCDSFSGVKKSLHVFSVLWMNKIGGRK